MFHHARTRRLILSLAAVLPLAASVESAAAQASAQATSAEPPGRPAAEPPATKPGRDPKQPVDAAYTAKIREYTTEPFFLSPLVDYLPASPTVPTPAAVLGDIAGSPTKLPYSKEVYEYMRLLEKASPRVKVFSIGTTEEGREMIAVAIASEALIARLEDNRAKLAQLADPRTIGMDDARAEPLIAEAAPVYYITGAIHSPEAGSPSALMELAYRLTVDESPYLRAIRDNLVTLITPVVEVDGRDRQVDIFNWHMKHPGETYPSLIYWGKYVAHDNNRDQMAMTLKLSQNVLNTFVGWKAQVLHDLHESYPYLYDVTSTPGAYAPWLDPLLVNEWHLLAFHNVQEMTRLGMPGVWTHGEMDNWSPGYLETIAATHNGISRLYETFGNGGTAETVERTLSPEQTARTWWRQNPPLPRVKWSMRNNNNYQQTGLLISLNHFATNRRLFLQNFYQKSKRSILKARTEGPAAYVLPATDPRPGAQAELLRVLRRQAVEVSRATAAFTVRAGGGLVPAAGGRMEAGGDALARSQARPIDDAESGKAGDRAVRGGPPKVPAGVPASRTFPAGSYVIRMDQPYSRAADALLDYEYFSPSGPQSRPYDDTGWTFPELFAVQSVRVTDPAVLDAPMERVDSVRAPGGVTGAGSPDASRGASVFLINHNGDNALATLRYRFKSADVQAAEEPFAGAGRRFARGSFVVRGVPAAELHAAARELGLAAYAVPAAPNVRTHPARAARVAILHTWIGTQTEGWWRQAFDLLKVPYDYISVQDVAKNERLNDAYDVIVFPPVGGSVQSIIDGLPMWRNPMPWKQSPETPNIGTWAQTDDIRPGLGWRGLANLQDFVARGGVLVTTLNTADFAAGYGLAHGVSVNHPPEGQVEGSVLRAKLVDGASPIAYGVPDDLAVYSAGGESFGVSNLRAGGRPGRRGAGGPARPTGRGTESDPDVPQARAPLEPRHEAPAPPRTQPWEAAPITDEQLRSPINIIPPDQRPRVVLRFAAQRELLVSGLLNGGGEIAERPVVVDVPVQKGHVVLFAINPIYRGQTIGSYPLVLNTLLHFDSLGAGRKLDPR